MAIRIASTKKNGVLVIFKSISKSKRIKILLLLFIILILLLLSIILLIELFVWIIYISLIIIFIVVNISAISRSFNSFFLVLFYWKNSRFLTYFINKIIVFQPSLYKVCSLVRLIILSLIDYPFRKLATEKKYHSE